MAQRVGYVLNLGEVLQPLKSVSSVLDAGCDLVVIDRRGNCLQLAIRAAGVGGCLVVSKLADCVAPGLPLTELLAELQELGVQLCSVADRIDPTAPTYDLLMSCLSGVAVRFVDGVEPGGQDGDTVAVLGRAS